MSAGNEIKPTNPAKLNWLGRKLFWLDNSKSADRIFYALLLACALLFIADFLYKKKSYFDLEGLPGFYGLFGFVICVLIVISARVLRALLIRPEDYYAPNDVESEEYPQEGLERETIDD